MDSRRVAGLEWLTEKEKISTVSEIFRQNRVIIYRMKGRERISLL